MKKIYLLLLLLVPLFFSGSFVCAENDSSSPLPNNRDQGVILASINDRLLSGANDKFLVSLGMKEHLIKGDILEILAGSDPGLINPAGLCPVIDVKYDSCICEVAKSRMELRLGFKVAYNKLKYKDKKYLSYIYQLLMRSVDPYEPERPVNIYIHDFYDKNNNVTALSKRLKDETEYIFSQKKKVVLKNVDLKLYPDSYRKYIDNIKNIMKSENIDVIITGFYSPVSENKSDMYFYKIDRNYGDERFLFSVNTMSPEEIAESTNIIKPYDNIETKEFAYCKIIYKDLQYVPYKDEIGKVIAAESNNNAFVQNELKRSSFNIVSPVDIDIRIDSEKIEFPAGKKEIVVPIMKGLHRVSASYKRGYFYNSYDTNLYTSEDTIAKEAIVDITKGGSLVIEITMNPVVGKDLLHINVFRHVEKDRAHLKVIRKVESGKSIDFYKD